VIGVLETTAQDSKRKFKELFPVGLRLSPSSYHLGVGVSRLWGPIGGESFMNYQTGDSTYNSRINSQGGIGLVVEGGYSRYYKENPILDQLDLTLSFRQLKGSQSHVGELLVQREDEEVLRVDTEGKGYFDNTYLNFGVDISKHAQLNETKYLIFGYGFGMGYRMFNTSTYTRDFGLQRLQSPKTFRSDAHVRMGYGFYYRKFILINALLEVPVISTDGLGTTTWFNSSYVPSILTLRITWLRRPASMECPPIRPGSGENAKKKDYLQELFHPDAKFHPAPTNKESVSD
jgi:hypothetical protein